MAARQLRFKIDENLPADVAVLLRSAGHDACTVADQRMTGADDATLARACASESRAIVTLDLDFADIRPHPPERLPEIVVFRLAAQDRQRIPTAVMRILPRFQTETLAGTLWIVEATQVRVRSGPEPTPS